jgi:hypothetical protein
MAIGPQSVPMRWPAGPLDMAKRQKGKSFTPEMAEVLRQWQDPSLLALLQGTPVNCLVVSWASGLPEDAEQQPALQPLLDRGRQAGLDIVGLVEGSADKTAALAAARSAGLSAVAMEAAPQGNAGLPVIAWGKSGGALWGANSPILGVADGLWPGIPQEKTPTGGPTNLPWVDSNGALLAMAQALAPGKAVWIVADPPQKAKLTSENYVLTVADVATYGGRWLISLDDQIRAGLAAKDAPAAEAWKKVTDTLAFFEQNKATRTYERVGRLAVMSDFAEPDRFLGEDSLNMLPRLREPFRVIPRSQALAAPFKGLQGLFYVDQEPPEAQLRKKLITFVKGGGTLFVRANWPNPEGTPIALSSAETYLFFNEFSLGRGRLAIAKEAALDSYFACLDIQNIMSHRGDPARLYNGASMNYFFQASPHGRQGVIHVLNYSRRSGNDNALIFLRTPCRSARFVSPEAAAPVALQVAPQAAGGVELYLPRLTVYGAVQIET